MGFSGARPNGLRGASGVIQRVPARNPTRRRRHRPTPLPTLFHNSNAVSETRQTGDRIMILASARARRGNNCEVQAGTLKSPWTMARPFDQCVVAPLCSATRAYIVHLSGIQQPVARDVCSGEEVPHLGLHRRRVQVLTAPTPAPKVRVGGLEILVQVDAAVTIHVGVAQGLVRLPLPEASAHLWGRGGSRASQVCHVGQSAFRNKAVHTIGESGPSLVNMDPKELEFGRFRSKSGRIWSNVHRNWPKLARGQTNLTQSRAEFGLFRPRWPGIKQVLQILGSRSTKRLNLARIPTRTHLFRC